MTTTFRVGHGFDAHRLVADRPFILGGVRIAFERGPLGHSDADVLAHALCDALLGACALGDLGEHFPDSDARFKGADSMQLLSACAAMVRERGYESAIWTRRSSCRPPSSRRTCGRFARASRTCCASKRAR